MLNLIINIPAEIIFSLLYFPSGLFEFVLKKDQLKSGSSKKQIIILHGWLTKNPLYFLLKHRLEKEGYVVHMPDLGWHLEDINLITDKLEKYVKENSLMKFTIIGHSCGGLIALSYLKRNPKMVNKIITLSTPFSGVSLMNLFSFFSQSARQITSYDDFLDNLISGCLPLRHKIYCLFPVFDELFSVKKAQLPFANNITIDLVGHLPFLYSSIAFKIIKSTIKRKI